MTFSEIQELIGTLGLINPGIIHEDDIDVINYETDRNDRKRRDAEVLTTLAANTKGNALEIGTGTGRSTYRIASNIIRSLSDTGLVHTVNLLPEQYYGSTKYYTYLLEKKEIGKYYRDKGCNNVIQYYANSRNWNVPGIVTNIKLAFIDGGHDAATVYQDSQLAYSLVKNGYIVWHDFNYDLRYKYDWIDEVMSGITKFLNDVKYDKPIYHLKNSFCGFIRI